jgi:hypothetical protein
VPEAGERVPWLVAAGEAHAFDAQEVPPVRQKPAVEAPLRRAAAGSPTQVYYT